MLKIRNFVGVAVAFMGVHIAGAFIVPNIAPSLELAGGASLRRRATSSFSQRRPLHSHGRWKIHGKRRTCLTMQLPIVELAGVVENLQAQAAALTLDDVAGGLFAFSLFPYLGFLYHLGKEENKTPELGLFGFKFLLVFVGASIPAAIAAKVFYGAQLADVDYLHGGAESFLAITNLFIVLGFRRAVAGTPHASLRELLSSPPTVATVVAIASTLYLSTLGLPEILALLATHAEPANALSFPTWMVHTSSLFEWLTAMGLVWRYAEVSGNPRWKGLTWGMLPFHSSGLCACTYHVFYNAAPVGGLVAMQSLLTVVGDLTCWYAAYRIYEYAREYGPSSQAPQLPAGWQQARDAATGATYYYSDKGETTWDLSSIAGSEGSAVGNGLFSKAAAGMDTEVVYFTKLVSLCVATSALVKWGELHFDFPFAPTYIMAFSLIGVPTCLNVLTWLIRSKAQDSDFNEFY